MKLNTSRITFSGPYSLSPRPTPRPIIIECSAFRKNQQEYNEPLPKQQRDLGENLAVKAEVTYNSDSKTKTKDLVGVQFAYFEALSFYENREAFIETVMLRVLELPPKQQEYEKLRQYGASFISQNEGYETCQKLASRDSGLLSEMFGDEGEHIREYLSFLKLQAHYPCYQRPTGEQCSPALRLINESNSIIIAQSRQATPCTSRNASQVFSTHEYQNK